MATSSVVSDYRQFSDADLVIACRRGEEAAWDVLVSRYERLVYTLASHYGIPQAAVSELFQSVWMSLLKNLKSIKRPDQVAAWLVDATRRELQARHKQWDPGRETPPDNDQAMVRHDGSDRSPDEIIDSYRKHESLRRAMNELEPRCKSLLRMLYFQPNIPSFTDVAMKLGLPIGSIGPMRARCLQQLKRLTGDYS